MKVGGCGISPISSDFYRCGGHDRVVTVARVSSQNGFLEDETQRRIGLQNQTLNNTSANVGSNFCRETVKLQQRRRVRFSSINSDPFLSVAVDNEVPSDVLMTKWAPNLQTLATGSPAWNERIGKRKVVGQPCVCCTRLSSPSRDGWKDNYAGGRTKKREVNGWRILPLYRLIRNPCAAFPGDDRVVMQEELDHTASPSGGRGSIYNPFVDFAVQELYKRRDYSPLLVKEEFRNMMARDVTANIDNLAFASSKIRLFRIATIQTGSSMQVLNIAGFARSEYDLPIFCADFYSVPNKNIIVLDLNPLYNTDSDRDYKERYYQELIPLANKFTEVLPWGDKLTAESLQFFSPLVLWTKAQKGDLTRYLYPAFQEYLGAWLNMVDSACPAADAVVIARNQEAQHRYISWRVTKDPGRALLTKLYGEQLSERYIEEFLFDGLSTLGTKSFLDYFPEYRSADGSICKQRSMIGKSFRKRPWDKAGSFSPS